MSENQCDGCIIGLPVVLGIHRTLENEPYMSCTKTTYRELEEYELKILNKIYSYEPIEYGSEHIHALRLQAFGYCRLSCQIGLTSFKTGSEDLFWHLTVKGEREIGIINNS